MNAWVLYCSDGGEHSNVAPMIVDSIAVRMPPANNESPSASLDVADNLDTEGALLDDDLISNA